MIIIGITGTLGAGKGTIVEYLTGKKNFRHYSVRAFLLEEIRRQGLPENRDSMFNVANSLRAEHGSSYVVDQLYIRAGESGKNCVIESIRTPGEVESLRKTGRFYLLAIDADLKIRYDRIRLRQSETDHISFETFLENEAREMNTVDPNKQNIRKCIQAADYTIPNNGTKEDLIREVEKILRDISGPGL
jgi:dephospho-CoA kinase